MTAQWASLGPWNFDYTGSVQTFSVPIDGYYKLEVWGSQGGRSWSGEVGYYDGGKGGYSYGTLYLSSSNILYVYVGERGLYSPNLSAGVTNAGGWNGGGSSRMRSGLYATTEVGGSGGGATDISIYGTPNSIIWNEEKHLYSRIIVAGAGGGADGHYRTTTNGYTRTGSYGGGETGQTNSKNLNGDILNNYATQIKVCK